MKTTTKLITTACALAMTFGSVICATDIYAASPSITINNDTESLYIDSGTKSSSDGTATYDASANTLTLNNFHGDDILVKDLDALTISLSGENTLTMSTVVDGANRGITAKSTNLKITGSGSLTVDRDELESLASSADVIKAAGITIESATINIKSPAHSCFKTTGESLLGASIGDASGSIIVESGNLSLSCGYSAFITNKLTVNGGKINSAKDLSSVSDGIDHLVVNDGEITVDGGSIIVDSDVEINGGTVNIKTNGSLDSGIELYSYTLGSKPRHFLMTGGNLNITKSLYGIEVINASAGSYIKFSGGTAKITSDKYTALISYKAKQDSTIIIDEGMFISPADMTISSDENGDPMTDGKYRYFTVANKKTVVITDDEDLVKETTEEEVKEEETVENKESSAGEKTEAAEVKPTTVKAPDTGIFSEGNNELVAIAISVGAVTLLSGIIYLSVYTRNRVAGRVKFNK